MIIKVLLVAAALGLLAMLLRGRRKAAHQAATDEGDGGQRDRPAQRQQQVAHDVPQRELNHGLP